jgi:hypothetical protein
MVVMVMMVMVTMVRIKKMTVVMITPPLPCRGQR